MVSKGKPKPNLVSSFKFASNGLSHGFINERNFKIHLVLGFIAVILSYVLKVSKIEFIIVILTIGLVLALELVNTSIENVVNMITKEYSHEAKVAKDIAAASVLIAALIAVIVGALIFVPKLLLVIN